jgi:hypothetical protein
LVYFVVNAKSVTNETLRIESPAQLSEVGQVAPVELTYQNIPDNHYLWLRVFGEDRDSDRGLYWPIALPSGESVIADISHDRDLHVWRSERGQGAWFNDPSTAYRLELIAVDASTNEYLKTATKLDTNHNGLKSRDRVLGIKYATETYVRTKPFGLPKR